MTAFADQPRLVFWEMTKACPLACVHCRATAQPGPLPGELSTAEGMRLIEDIASGPRPHPVLILTGGDCLTRPDLVELAARAKELDVPVAIAPAVSPRLSADLLARLREQGVSRVSLSLDGAVAATHERIRQVPGHFQATLDAIALLVDSGFHVQINTAVMAGNVGELADIAALLYRSGVQVWEVFFLVNVGRGDEIADITPEQGEDVCHFLVDAARYGIIVRTVEAPFFRRVLRERTAGGADPTAAPDRAARGRLYRALSDTLAAQLGAPTTRVLAPTAATRDGKGIVFVAHNGDVYPSGFLPLTLGNVRDDGLLATYRDHPLLQDIRAANFAGRCGSCEYSDLCGGSRARAYAATGDALGDDPACLRVAAAALG